MLWLPTLVAHPSRVAVSDRSALALERALLAESEQAACAALSDSMLGDGRFAVWVQGLAGNPIRSIGELAKWLSRNLNHVLTELPTEASGAWEQLQDWDARGLAAGAVAAPRAVDPAHNWEWRTASPDYVARLMQTLAEHPCAWPNDGDEEFCRYASVDEGIAWRLPRLIRHLSRREVSAAELDTRIQTARLEAMKELAYGASHEINNPLANISGRAQLLLKGESDPQRRRMLASIDSQALRAHEMISDLMHFARPPRLAQQDVCVGKLVETVVAELEGELAERQIRCEVFTQTPCDRVIADQDQLHMAVRGVLQNAIEAIGVGGRIEATIRTADDRQQVEITVADTGRGIPEEIRSRIFDPFFSGREAGRGLGFGLARAWRILTDHGGIIELVKEPGFSTAFRLRLPFQASPE